MNTAMITSWLLTYLAHSTILLGAAWLGTRILGDRRLALQETLLRTALVGGLLTATLQVGLGIEPIGGALAIVNLSPAEIVTMDGGAAVGNVESNLAPSPAPTIRSQALDSWPAALLSLWGLGSMLALLVLGRSILDLRRLLKTRRFRPTGRLLDRLAVAMGLRRSVRLSTSAAIAVPFATGIRKPEICCPERVGDLALEHQKSLFAHELAHLARRDPAWQILYRLGEALLFLQPLNRLVRRRLEEIAEHLTDERAVACTGDRLGLARCLVVVAHWGVSDAPGLPATAFAAGLRLDRRVRRLISGTIGQHRTARWTVPLLIALVVGSVILLPAIAPSSVHADISPSSPEGAPARTWSTSIEETNADAPAPPPAPVTSELPQPVAPMTDVVPAPGAVPGAPKAPRPVSALAPVVEPVPAPVVEPAPPALPESGAYPAPPASPTAPEPPPKAHERAPEEPTARERKGSKDEARDRRREAQREHAEAEARARERTRALEAEARAVTEQARELAREAAERVRLTDAEREKLQREVRELRRLTETEVREHTRLAAERMRLTDAEREEIRRRVEELHAEARETSREAAREAREQVRELAVQARRLAEEAEAQRQKEEERRRLEEPR